MTTPINVLIVDDHPVLRRGLAQIIDEDEALKVIAEAGSGPEALKLMETTPVDVVVTDLAMPGMDGLELATRLIKHEASLPVVLLTVHKNERVFNEAIDRGVRAYLLKDEVVETITAGIRAAATGEAFLSPSLSEFVMRRGNHVAEVREKNTGLSNLTPTELKILKLIAQQHSSKEIASQLTVSYRTVTTHRSRISHKLGLTNKQSLQIFAIANKSAVLSLKGKPT